ATLVVPPGTRDSRLAVGRQRGAVVIVNSRAADPGTAGMEATGGKGADLVIDCAGGDETFDQSIRMAKPGGKVLLVAFYHGPVTADVSHAVRRNITIYTERGEGGTSVGRALALLAAGRLTAKPLITHQFPLGRVHDALVKPMPGKSMAPSLAESWSVSSDGLVYEFVLRKGTKFHTGDPVTAEDVKFSFERYRGIFVRALKEHVASVETPDPGRVR